MAGKVKNLSGETLGGDEDEEESTVPLELGSEKARMLSSGGQPAAVPGSGG